MSKEFFKPEVLETIDASVSKDNSESHHPFKTKVDVSHQGKGAKWQPDERPHGANPGVK